jgi:hypothetical protein
MPKAEKLTLERLARGPLIEPKVRSTKRWNADTRATGESAADRAEGSIDEELKWRGWCTPCSGEPAKPPRLREPSHRHPIARTICARRFLVRMQPVGARLGAQRVRVAAPPAISAARCARLLERQERSAAIRGRVATGWSSLETRWDCKTTGADRFQMRA